jgi:hypothetical protein
MSGASGFRFATATRADEPEIRALVGGLAMPGAVSVRFAREPDYFLGTTVQGDPCDVLIARHEPDDTLAALMVRAERRVYLDGEEARVAYIGQIRIAPRFQGRWLMQRAVLELGELHEQALPYTGVIAGDNAVALGTIAGRRPPGAPHVVRIARLRSLAFLLHDRFVRRRASLPVERGDDARLDEIVAFLREYGRRRQLFPVLERDHFRDGQTYRDLRLADLGVVRRDGRIAGVLGSWDQSAYKQEIVEGYSKRLRRLRPAYDLLALLMGAQRLPRPGAPIRTAFGCLRCLADDDPDVLAALLDHARERAARQGQAFLMVGFDDREPLLRSLGRPLTVTYQSDVFLGSFAGEGTAVDLDGRPVHVEIGAL